MLRIKKDTYYPRNHNILRIRLSLAGCKLNKNKMA